MSKLPRWGRGVDSQTISVPDMAREDDAIAGGAPACGRGSLDDLFLVLVFNRSRPMFSHQHGVDGHGHRVSRFSKRQQGQEPAEAAWKVHQADEILEWIESGSLTYRRTDSRRPVPVHRVRNVLPR